VNNIQSRNQSGVVLISVIVILLIVGAIALTMISSASQDNAQLAALTDGNELDYLTESAMAHAQWRLSQNATCSGYSDLPVTNFGSHSYSASFAPANGSPVTISVDASLSSGPTRTLSKTVSVFPTPVALSWQPGPEGIDAYIRDGANEARNFGASNILKINNQSAEEAALLYFDTSAVPFGATIDSATLSLWLEGAENLSNGNVAVYRVTQAWVEGDLDGSSPPAGAGVTYQSYNGQTNWANHGGDYDSTPIDTITIPSMVAGWQQWNVQGLVQYWVDNSSSNTGMIVRAPSGNVKKIFFTSSDGVAGQRPKLDVTYSCSCGVICVLPESGGTPTGHWTFDDGAGLTAIDSVGGNDGDLVSGPSWTEGAVAGALQFDGSNDSVDINHDDSLALGDKITIAAWINPDVIGPFYQTIVQRDPAGHSSNYYFSTWGAGLSFGFTTNNTYREAYVADAGLTTGEWHHVAATFDNASNEVRLYHDGIEVLATSITQNPSTSDAIVTIGRSSTGEYFDGSIDDVRIYDQVLTSAELLNVSMAVDQSDDDEIDEDTEGESGGGGGDPAGGKCDGTYRDEFNSESFSGSDGTLDWASSWVEVGEDDGPKSGDIALVKSSPGFQLQTRDNDNGGEGVQRTVDLSGASRAFLNYDHQRVNLDKRSDYATVEISTKGDDGPWVELNRHAGPDDDKDLESNSIDISAHMSSATTIRFITSSSLGKSDIVYFDNIEVSCSP